LPDFPGSQGHTYIVEPYLNARPDNRNSAALEENGIAFSSGGKGKQNNSFINALKNL
jgi:hypothetical protein